jgi:hypothetical protein
MSTAPGSIPWSPHQGERERQFALAITQLISEVAALKADSGSARPRAVLPHLDKFDGTAADLDAWVLSAEAKLHVDGAAIGDAHAQFYYLHACLAPAVKRKLLSFAKVPANRSPQRLIDKLQASYGEPNARQQAGQQMALLSQRSDERIHAYLLRFEEVLYRAGAESWPDAAKINSLVVSLNRSWRHRLSEQHDIPEKYDALLTYLRKLGSNTFLSSSSSSVAPAAAAGPANAGDPMDISVNRIRPAPLDEAALAQRRKWKKEGRCTGCGSRNHWSQKCPKASVETRIRALGFTQGGERSARSGHNDDCSSEDD